MQRCGFFSEWQRKTPNFYKKSRITHIFNGKRILKQRFLTIYSQNSRIFAVGNDAAAQQVMGLWVIGHPEGDSSPCPLTTSLLSFG